MPRVVPPPASYDDPPPKEKADEGEDKGEVPKTKKPQINLARRVAKFRLDVGVLEIFAKITPFNVEELRATARPKSMPKGKRPDHEIKEEAKDPAVASASSQAAKEETEEDEQEPPQKHLSGIGQLHRIGSKIPALMLLAVLTILI